MVAKIIKLIYYVNKERVKILGHIFLMNNKNKCKVIYNNKKYNITEEFIENNKNNCKIIIDNKEQELIEYLKINKNEKILKIKLKEIKSITNMSCMFDGCNSLTSLPDISNWNTNNVTDMSGIFCRCNSLPLKFIINN